MSLSIRCPECRTSLQIPKHLDGKAVRCPKCKVTIPPTPASSLTPSTVPPTKPILGRVPPSAPLNSPQSLLSPPQLPDEIGRLGTFRVLRLIGAGGMGAVFEAEDPQLQRRVALKVMSPALSGSSEARGRFLREARSVAAISHPNVITVHQFGEVPGANECPVLFLTMPLLRGETLDSRLHRPPTLTIPELLRIGREIAEGLAAAHAEGLIHRDIKPSNIWLELSADSAGVECQRVKLLDFGLARHDKEDVTLTPEGTVLGTPAFMAPEQAAGVDIDYRCDLFSLGSVLYCAATGQKPFRGENAMQVLHALANSPSLSPRELRTDLPDPFSRLILRLLSRDPGQRPSSASAIALELAELSSRLKNDTDSDGSEQSAEVSAHDARPTQRGSPPSGKGRGKVMALLLLAIVLLAGGAGIWGFQQLTDDEDSPHHKVVAQPEVSPFDRLNPADISAEERFAWQPKELVAVLGEHCQRHWSAVREVAFSPDGKHLASCGKDQLVQIWDLNNMRRPRQLDTTPNLTSSLSFLDTETLATASRTDLRIWNLSEPKPTIRHRFLTLRDNPWRQVRISVPGQWLAASKESGEIHVWNLAPNPPSDLRILKGHKGPVLSLSPAPDGKYLASGGMDGVLHLWNLQDNDKGSSRKLFIGQVPVHSLAWSNDGKQLMSGDGAGAIRRWDLQQGEPKELPPYVTDGPVYTLTMIPNSSTAVYAAGDHLYCLQGWDAKPIKLAFRQHVPGQPTYSLSAKSDGSLVASGGEDTTVRLWDLKDVNRPREIGPRSSQVALAYATQSPDGKQLAFGSSPLGIVVNWHFIDNRFQERSVLTSPNGGWAPVAFLSAQRLLATPWEWNTLRLWDLTQLKPVPVRDLIRMGDNSGIVALAHTRDGRWLAASDQDDNLRLWNTEHEVPKASRGRPLGGRRISFTSDNRHLVAVGHSPASEGAMRIFEIVADEFIERVKVTRKQLDPCGLAVMADGDRIAVNDADGIRMFRWDGLSLHEETGISGSVNTDSLSFSPNGKLLVGSGYNCVVSLWDAETKVKLRSWALPGTTTVSFCHDGRHILLANSNGTVYILRVGDLH